MGMEMFCVMRVSVGLIRTHIWWEPLWIFWWEHFTGGAERGSRNTDAVGRRGSSEGWRKCSEVMRGEALMGRFVLVAGSGWFTLRK